MRNNYIHYTQAVLITITSLLLSTQSAKAQWSKALNFNIGKVNTINSSEFITMAGTDTGGIYVSNDFGLNWTEKNTGITNKNIRSIIQRDTVTIIGVGNGFGGAVFVSKNLGDTWDVPTNPYSGFLYCMVEQGNNLLAGTWSGVAKSTDNGDKWVTLPITGLPSNASVTALFAKGDTIFAAVSSSSVGGEGIFRSTDNGNTWTIKNSGITNKNYTAIQQSGNTLIAATKGGGGIYISANNGDSWTISNSGLTNLGVNNLFVSGKNILACTNEGIFLSKDNAATWVDISAGLPTGTQVFSVAASGHFLLIGTDSTVWRRPTAEVITGIKSVKNNNVNIYPNPSNGAFTLELLENTTAQQVTVSNLIGQVVYASQAVEGAIQFDISNAGKGIYFLQIKTAQGLINKRVVVE